MGCSTSKLEPEDQLDATPSKPAGWRGFASDLFGRARKNHRRSGSDGTAGGGRQLQGEEQRQQQQGRKGRTDGARELARSPGSPSFRYYCENNAAFAVAEPKKERR
ncbi:hypothetical protein E2562_006773 [Oryza meyeriana var. granulata]|uniref:Uncharacterized protein n=1 Tax=Oryza meyeriana var. granulata TaxID=110450 RepID=A0A6G1C3L7_9ORYZ|nr:hypothetical protein E2562_006773 [Oryza meyeriana var. granulata]